MNRVDLHIHSTASDGRYRPEEIVAMAADKGLEVIALADHDSVDGLAPALQAARAFPHLKVIPGIEVSTDLPGGEAHVLGYFIDHENRDLKPALERFRNSRRRRAEGMVDRLADMGVRIDFARVREIAGDAPIGRPHIAQAMLEKGYVKAIRDAFSGYLEHGGPAYVAREKMTPAEAVAFITGANALPVLAHPYTVPDPEAMVAGLKKAGLVGLEAYCKDYTPDAVNSLLKLAEKHGLIATGGSDFHGFEEDGAAWLGGVAVPLAAAESLLALAGERAGINT